MGGKVVRDDVSKGRQWSGLYTTTLSHSVSRYTPQTARTPCPDGRGCRIGGRVLREMVKGTAYPLSAPSVS